MMVYYLKSLPTRDTLQEKSHLKQLDEFFVIFDRTLLKNSDFRFWIRQFPLTYPVTSGESLKDIKNFSKHIEKIVGFVGTYPRQGLCVVACGGGSVGDFAGFVASILKRGVPLVHMPSTALACLDSAHGGKNALNVNGVKNQVGTFYHPRAVLICRDLLSSLPEREWQSASGELIKIAVIEGGALWQKVRRMTRLDAEDFWRLLPAAVRAKYRLVNRDPIESKGLRSWLNLGHTMGHVLEAKSGLPHGRAVGHGMRFSLEWSLARQFVKPSNYQAISLVLSRFGYGVSPVTLKARKRDIKKVLMYDKKMDRRSQIKFVFIERPGRVRLEKVKAKDILREGERQGWLSEG